MPLNTEVINLIVKRNETNLTTHQALWHKTCLAVPEFGNFMSELKGKMMKINENALTSHKIME